MSEAAVVSQKERSKQAAALLFIHAQTELHPGSGTALGTVDLPVQRERHTQWPIVPASTLKGILRDACRPRSGNQSEREDWLAAFGPETAEADKHAGALSLTDARILAFPVRSLSGVFAWVTCTAVLERLNRDLSIANLKPLDLPRAPDKGKALCPESSPLLVGGDKLVLEEFEFDCTGDASTIAEWVSEWAVADGPTKERLRNHLVVLHDDDFTHFVRHATVVVARVGLDYERKTVKKGALFYEEFLPTETIFYSVVLTSASRRDGHGKDADQVMDFVRRSMPEVLQIGADETIGKGLCFVRLQSERRVPDAGRDGDS